MPPVMYVSGPGQPMQASPWDQKQPLHTCPSPHHPNGDTRRPEVLSLKVLPSSPPNPLLKPKVPCLNDTKRWEILSQSVALAAVGGKGRPLQMDQLPLARSPTLAIRGLGRTRAAPFRDFSKASFAICLSRRGISNASIP